jgi:hypothetical protein
MAKMGQIRVKRSMVYFGDMVTGATAGDFSSTMTGINPGLPGVFPWLAGIANNFEQYRIHQLRVFHRPILPTTADGFVCLAFDYDAADPKPSNLADMFQYGGAKESSIWKPVSMSCKPSGWLFTRSAALEANLDIKTYDHCNLIFGCQNTSSGANSLCGQLFIDYDISFRRPQKDTTTASGQSRPSTEGGIPANTSGVYDFFSNFEASSKSISSPGPARLNIGNGGKYLIRLAKTILDTGDSLTVTSPTAATIAGELENVAIFQPPGYELTSSELPAFVDDIAAWVVSSEGQTNGTDSLASGIYELYVDLNRATNFNFAEKFNGGSYGNSDLFTSGGGWGTLWNSVLSSASVALTAYVTSVREKPSWYTARFPSLGTLTVGPNIKKLIADIVRQEITPKSSCQIEKDEDVTTSEDDDNCIERECISCGLVMKLRSRNQRMFCAGCLSKVYSDVPPKN